MSLSVLHIDGRLEVGGIEQYLLDFIPAATRRGVRSNILTLFEREPGALAPKFEELGCRIFPCHALRRRGALKSELLRAVKETGADVVHSHVGEMSGDPMRILAGAGPLLVAQAHDLGGLTRWPLAVYRKLSRRRTLRYSDKLIAVSNEAGRRLASGSGRTFTVVPAGLDTSKWTRDPDVRDRVRAELSISEGAYLILHVGRFDPVKNHKFLLEVAVRLLWLDVPFVLCLVGDGALMKETESRSRGLRLSESVRFLGRRDDVRELMSAADLKLLPSFSEGTPRVLLEAACVGLKFLVTANADLADLFEAECRLPIDDAALWAERALEALTTDGLAPQPLIDLSIERAVDQTLAVYGVEANTASTVVRSPSSQETSGL